MSKKKKILEPPKEHIHEYFGLSYANYLVLPRSILQSMPENWQERFVANLNEIIDFFGIDWEPDGGYKVLALDENKKTIKDKYADYERGRRRIEFISKRIAGKLKNGKKKTQEKIVVLELRQDSKKQGA